MSCGLEQSRIIGERSGRGLPSLRAGAPRRSQQCPRPDRFSHQVLLAGWDGHERRPKADTRRADELLSQALALDPTNAWAHSSKAWNLRDQGRIEEALAERERALVLDPGDVGTLQSLAWDHVWLGHFDKGLELFDKSIRLSPRDPALQFMYLGKSWTYFALKQYDQAIDWARRAIVLGTSIPFPHLFLAAALALTGQEAEAREALQQYLALPSSERLRTIAAFKEYNARFINPNSDRRVLDNLERHYEGLRKAGMPEGEAKSN